MMMCTYVGKNMWGASHSSLTCPNCHIQDELHLSPFPLLPLLLFLSHPSYPVSVPP